MTTSHLTKSMKNNEDISIIGLQVKNQSLVFIFPSSDTVHMILENIIMHATIYNYMS